MNFRQAARSLGRRGGQARARNLSSEERKKIASHGGRTKALSQQAGRRIETNFQYLEAIETLRKFSRAYVK